MADEKLPVSPEARQAALDILNAQFKEIAIHFDEVYEAEKDDKFDAIAQIVQDAIDKSCQRMDVEELQPCMMLCDELREKIAKLTSTDP